MVEEIKQGDRVTFTYHGKPRSGKVDKALQTVFVLELDEPEDGTKFKGFKHNKVENMVIVR